MYFELSEHHLEKQKEYAAFAQKEMVPLFDQMEETASTPQIMLDKMADAKMYGIPMPTAYGGLGDDFLTAVIHMEELAKINPAVPGLINVSTEIVSVALLQYGTEDQKNRYLPPLCSGKSIGAFALTEPGAGSDASGVKTFAAEKEDGWVLNGTKCFITNAELADVFLIAAQTDVGGGKRKISMFIVEKGTPGFEIGAHENKMGLRASSTCELILNDCRLPKENLLGEKGKGLKIALGGLDGGRVMIAAQGLGIAQGVWDEAVEFLKTNTADMDGLINRQQTQFELAKMEIKIEAARLLVYRAAGLWSAGKPFGKAAAMAKYYASDIANEAARLCMQFMGYRGCSLGSRTEQFFRDAKITEIYEGTNEIQLMVIAGLSGLKA